MKNTENTIRCEVKLLRPAEPKAATWAFLLLPKEASAHLPTRGLTAVQGRLNDHPFRASLEPDGQGSHWMKVDKKLQQAAGVAPGDRITLEILAEDEESEPDIPADFRRALSTDAKAKALWTSITVKARRDWIHWITSAKQEETRARRIDGACDMLASGKKRVCCFDRSGIYSKSMSAPKAAE